MKGNGAMTKRQRLQSFTSQDDVNAAVVIAWQIPPFCNCQAAGPLVLDGTKGTPGHVGKHQLADEMCTIHFESHVKPWVYRLGGTPELRRTK